MSGEGWLVMEVGWYFGTPQPRRSTVDAPGIPDGQSAPASMYLTSLLEKT